jgi:hypothetical protein
MELFNTHFLLGKMKLLEVQYARSHQIVTQDMMMNTAKGVLRGKMLTLENLISKTNLKLGGLNYNLLLENPR